MSDDRDVSGTSKDARRGPLQRFASVAHRLLHPHYEQEQAQTRRTLRTVEKSLRAQQRLASRIDALTEAVGAQSKQLDELAGRLRTARTEARHLRSETRSRNRLQAQLLKRADLTDEHRLAEERLSVRATRWSRGTSPIVVGPWTGEVGFELLYWIPFVRWVTTKFKLAPERLVIVSRGGAAAWYGDVAQRSVDILSFVSPDEFRAEAAQLRLKQRDVSAFDRRLVRQALRHCGLKRAAWLHPTLMYGLFNPYWKRQVTSTRIDAFAAHRLVPSSADVPLPPGLPDDYVAARFYFSRCFPETPANRTFVREALERLAESHHVVLLNTDMQLDDHAEFALPSSERIHLVSSQIRPDTNLRSQTAIIRRSKAFVGTYGGFSYLAPLCGVNSLAFYSERNFFSQHLELAQQVFVKLGGASLVCLDVRDREMVGATLGRTRASDRA